VTRLKAGITETTDVDIARQLHGNYVSTATNADTIEDAVFSMQSMPMIYNEDQLDPCAGGFK
jgi:hypothetical protein